MIVVSNHLPNAQNYEVLDAMENTSFFGNLVVEKHECFHQVNNYIIRSSRDVIVVANIVTRRTSNA